MPFPCLDGNHGRQETVLLGLHMGLGLQAHKPTALGFEKERLGIADFQSQRPMILARCLSLRL